MIIDFDINAVYSAEGFKDYYYLRLNNPTIDYSRFKPQIGNSLYKFELAFQSLIQDTRLN
jgi:hypothetical protein